MGKRNAELPAGAYSGHRIYLRRFPVFLFFCGIPDPKLFRKGLVPENLIQSGRFVLSVTLGAGLTVLLATRLGFPISTTHGLVGALVGAGLIGAGSAVNFSTLGKTFFIPLIISPVMAVVLSSLLYLLFTKSRRAAGISIESCVCIGKKWIPLTSVLKTRDRFTTFGRQHLRNRDHQ